VDQKKLKKSNKKRKVFENELESQVRLIEEKEIILDKFTQEDRLVELTKYKRIKSNNETVNKSGFISGQI